VFRRQKFCTKACADQGGLRYFGPDNANWNGDPRRKHRIAGYARWAKLVVSRDEGKCRICGANDIEVQAHHIKSYRDHPELRLEVDNGLTVCAPCHWQIHSKDAANGVNSGEAASGNAGGNPEPSFGRKPVEGATTRGRAYRRWNGQCDQCGTHLSRRLSDVTGKAHLFCSYACAGKFKTAHRAPPTMNTCLECKAPYQVGAWRAETSRFCGHSCRTRWCNLQRYGSNASTSAPHPPSRVMI
jgi:hypothetical protein